MLKLASLIEEHADELSALETLDNGKAYSVRLRLRLTPICSYARAHDDR